MTLPGVNIVDGFCGGGGASLGMELALHRHVTVGVNHDEEAIRIHMVNHPFTIHLTEDIWQADIRKYLNDQCDTIGWFSPDCTQFSKAKGSKPREQGIRMLPWAVYKHVSEIRPLVFFMENVEEIEQWGPLDENGRPIKELEGTEYRKFIEAISALGYKYETKILTAADYGAPTTRKRWYAVFRRDGLPIRWPKQTHSKNASVPGTKPWEPAWKYLDLDDLGQSIFDRKKPLAEKTMKRIARGIEKFVLKNPEPFIVVVNHGGEAFRGQSIKEPFSTITAKHGFGMVTPLLIQYHSETGPDVRGQDLNQPIQTLDTSNRYGLVSAFITKFYKSGTGQDITDPAHTITTSPGHFGLTTAFLTSYYGNEESCDSINNPLRTITTKDRFGLVAAFLTRYYGTSDGQNQNCSVDMPLGTITTKDRYGLVTVSISGTTYAIADIYLRMLKPEELKRLQGFPDSYVLDHDINGKAISRSEQTKKIGNSVVPLMAKLIVDANCPNYRA